jgi:hypothetical protein
MLLRLGTRSITAGSTSRLDFSPSSVSTINEAFVRGAAIDALLRAVFDDGDVVLVSVADDLGLA